MDSTSSAEVRAAFNVSIKLRRFLAAPSAELLICHSSQHGPCPGDVLSITGMRGLRRRVGPQYSRPTVGLFKVA